MIAAFDFEDALARLFGQHQARRRYPIAEKSGSAFYATMSYVSNKILTSKTPHMIGPFLEEFMPLFSKHGLKIVVADNGLENISRKYMVGAFLKVNWIRNRFFYFKMISSVRRKVSEEDRKFFEENERIREIIFSTSFGAYAQRIVWLKNIVAWFRKNEVTIQNAPQSASNQALYWHLIDPGSLISCSPLVFLYSDLDFIVDDIDFEKGEIIEYDFGLLASSLGLSKAKLRKCLLGGLMGFAADPLTRNSISYIDSFADNFNVFEVRLKELMSKKDDLLNKLINNLKTHFETESITESFADELAALIPATAREIDDHCSYYFNNIVLDKKLNAVSFPGSKVFKSTRFILDDVDERLIQLFCLGHVLEEIIHFYSKIHDHSYILIFPKFEFVEYAYLHNVYHKEHFEWTLAKFVSIFPPLRPSQFKFQYFDNEPIELKLTPPLFHFKIPAKGFTKPITIYSAIFNFCRSIQSNQEFRPVDKLTNKPEEDALAYIFLVLMHQLKYIDLEARKILVLAASLIKSGIGDFLEDLILIFEIIRHNLLMEDVIVNGQSIFKNFESFMNNNVFDDILYNDNICSIFLKSFSGKSDMPQLGQGLEFSSQSFLLTKSHQFGPNQKLTGSNDKFQIGLTKSLTVFYRTIKEFQSDYQGYYSFDKSSVKADLILNQAFDNFALKTLIIGSRVFSFIKTDFIIPDLFAIDMIQFQQIITAVQRSLSSVVSGSKIRFLFKSPNAPSISFLESIKEFLPFEKNYSVDGGKLFKIIATRFLIYRTLRDENDLAARNYAKSFSRDILCNEYGVDFCLQEFLWKGKEFIDKLSLFISCVREMSQVSIYTELSHYLNELKDLVLKILEFYSLN